MHQIQLTDQVYKQAKNQANEAGFTSVDESVADVPTHAVFIDTENLDHLFTPERIAHIDAVISKVHAGGATFTMEQVREKLGKNRADWMQRNDL